MQIAAMSMVALISAGNAMPKLRVARPTSETIFLSQIEQRNEVLRCTALQC